MTCVNVGLLFSVGSDQKTRKRENDHFKETVFCGEKKSESAMHGTLIIVVSTSTDATR